LSENSAELANLLISYRAKMILTRLKSL